MPLKHSVRCFFFFRGLRGRSHGGQPPPEIGIAGDGRGEGAGRGVGFGAGVGEKDGGGVIVVCRGDPRGRGCEIKDSAIGAGGFTSSNCGPLGRVRGKG